MISRLRKEVQYFIRVWRGLDQQVVWIFILASFLIIVQYAFGSRRFFYREIAQFIDPANQELYAWAWWFGTQFVTGFVIPVAALLLMGKKPSSIGLGLGDWKLASTIMLLYLPLVVVGTWILTASPEFQQSYPHLRSAAFSWKIFLIYHCLYLMYWTGWEYIWRGFILFGTAPKLGVYAIFAQALPFAALHFMKPFPEAVLSIVGGIALGFLVWRCRSFWIAVPIHACQVLILDFISSMRIRTGINGIGLDDFFKIFGGI